MNWLGASDWLSNLISGLVLHRSFDSCIDLSIPALLLLLLFPFFLLSHDLWGLWWAPTACTGTFPINTYIHIGKMLLCISLSQIRVHRRGDPSRVESTFVPIWTPTPSLQPIPSHNHPFLLLLLFTSICACKVATPERPGFLGAIQGPRVKIDPTWLEVPATPNPTQVWSVNPFVDILWSFF